MTLDVVPTDGGQYFNPYQISPIEMIDIVYTIIVAIMVIGLILWTIKTKGFKNGDN